MSTDMIRIIILIFMLPSAYVEAASTRCGKIDHPLLKLDIDDAKTYGIEYSVLKDDAYPSCKVVDVMAPMKLSSYSFSGFKVQQFKNDNISGEFFSGPIEGEDSYRTVFLMCEVAAEIANVSIHFGGNCFGKTIEVSLSYYDL